MGKGHYWGRLPLLVAVGDATTTEVVWGELDLHTIAREDPDVVHPHLPRDVREDFVTVFEFHPEHCVRQWLGDRSFQNDRVFLWLRQFLFSSTRG